jgi:predicted DNA-binding transcriptional regulator
LDKISKSTPFKGIPMNPTKKVKKTNRRIGNNIVLSDSEGYEKVFFLLKREIVRKGWLLVLAF